MSHFVDLNPSAEATSMAIGAGVGVMMVGLLGSIASVISARETMAAFERKLEEWDRPSLKFEPIRREFRLYQLHEFGEYLFKRLPGEISILRQINIDLEAIAREPMTVFRALLERVAVAGAGMTNEEAGKRFAELVDHPVPLPPRFDPEKSDLHAPYSEMLELMRTQHNTVTLRARGPVYGGSWEQDSECKDVSTAAMMHELQQGREQLEKIAMTLLSANVEMADSIEYTKENFPALIAMYEIAVLAYNEHADEEAVSAFANIYAALENKADDDALDTALALALTERERLRVVDEAKRQDVGNAGTPESGKAEMNGGDENG